MCICVQEDFRWYLSNSYIEYFPMLVFYCLFKIPGQLSKEGNCSTDPGDPGLRSHILGAHRHRKGPTNIAQNLNNTVRQQRPKVPLTNLPILAYVNVVTNIFVIVEKKCFILDKFNPVCWQQASKLNL